MQVAQPEAQTAAVATVEREAPTEVIRTTESDTPTEVIRTDTEADQTKPGDEPKKD
ncbi:transmembrane protein [Mycobacterium tuberculosis]|nr:transmembrane protein [Mycobacterium tuberculosis]CKT46950.1 transmembrane protein [Mycobacterium tuberculosis]CNV53233.1 transmembrane protein [Mycobacterium tuberculosis]COX37139.1 transmembrane protein [Mycobacterium tuberculosis]COY13437.1 transmembrane protein [Mycobacterium tuberculosis]